MSAPRESSSRPAPRRGESPLDWARRSGLGAELAEEIRRTAGARRRRRLALGGGFALLLVATGLTFGGRWPAAPAHPEHAAVVLAPERTVLPDGSIVELKAGAQVRVAFTPTERRVLLLAGEAHFQVTKNPQRPFVVAAHDLEVRAVGTAFSVELSPSSVAVVVSEGRVAVEPAAAGPSPSAVPAAAFVDQGQRLTCDRGADPEPRVMPVSAEELAAALAWRVPRLELSGTPLTDVVALFRQHGRVKLFLEEAALGDVRVSGVLRADNTDALFRLLAADHGISAEPRGDGFVLKRGP
jgi:transmembrane sensor